MTNLNATFGASGLDINYNNCKCNASLPCIFGLTCCIAGLAGPTNNAPLIDFCLGYCLGSFLTSDIHKRNISIHRSSNNNDRSSPTTQSNNPTNGAENNNTNIPVVIQPTNETNNTATTSTVRLRTVQPNNQTV